MKRLSMPQTALLGLFFLVAGQQFVEAQQTVDFDGTMSAGTSLEIKATPAATVSVYILAAADAAAIPAPSCSDTDLDNPKYVLRPLGSTDPTPTVTVPGTGAKLVSQTLTLSTALAAGDYVCLYATWDGSPDAQYKGLAVPKPPAMSIKFAGNLVPGANTIAVQGAAKAEVVVWRVSAADKTASETCTARDRPYATPLLLAGNSQSSTTTLKGADPQSVTLAAPLTAGMRLCLKASLAEEPTYSEMVTVAAPQAAAAAPAAPAGGAATQPSFVGKVVGGSSSALVTGSDKETVAVYQFDASYNGAETNCESAITKPKEDETRNQWKPLAIPQSGSSAGTQYSIQLSGSSSPYTITFAQPLAIGTKLCLKETSSDLKTVTYSAYFQDVTDSNSIGRFRATITGGAVISNQLQSGNSSTAAPFLDAELAYTWQQAQRHALGVESFLDSELTAVPVSASSTTATPTTSGTGSTATTQALNVLSSQQSLRILLGVYTPFRTTRWYHRTNWLTLAPLAKAGFDTLLNPSTGSASTTTTGATTVTTTNFSSVYDSWAGGARVGWEQYSNATDEAPRDISWFTATLGNYSNLPSYVCDPKKSFGTVTTKPTTTSCFTTVTSNGTTTYTLDDSRKLVPRIEIGGFLLIPNTSIAVGLDANLGQYFRYQHVDPLSKPGNDVRLYFGYQLDLASALKKLGVP